MTGTPILDVMLAMAFFFLALSLACSTLNDLVSHQLGWRANNMTAGVRSLLMNAQLKIGPDWVDAVDAVFGHALVQTRRRQAKVAGAAGARLGFFAKLLRGAIRNPLRAVMLRPPVDAAPVPGQEAKPDTPLDFDALSGSDFVRVLFDLIRPKNWQTGAALTTQDVTRWVEQLDDEKAKMLKSALKALVSAADGDTDALRASLVGWYDSAREQATAWYRQRMRTTSVVVGGIMCFVLNIDSIEFADRVRRDSDFRAAVVAGGRELPKQSEKGKDVPPEDQKKAKDFLTGPGKLEFGWGSGDWGATWKRVEDKWHANCFMGLVVTTLAISMGAPFWYKIVGKIEARFLGPDNPPNPDPKGTA